MDDLIDRQAAIEAIERAVTKEVARWSVKELPSAHPLNSCEMCLYKGKGWDEEPCDGCTGTESKYEPDSGWIPVGERLPEGGHNIIFCDSRGNVCEGVYHAILGQWVGFRWNAIYHHDDVMAWMPMPDPYKEEER